MRFMMLMIPKVYQPDTPTWERAGEGFIPPADAVERMAKYNEELAKAGVLIALEGLHPAMVGARVSFAGGMPVVAYGHSLEVKEVIGGYWLINVASREEAIDWAKRCPASDGDVIEIRQVFEVSEFPPSVRTLVEGAGKSLPQEKSAGCGEKPCRKAPRRAATGGA